MTDFWHRDSLGRVKDLVHPKNNYYGTEEKQDHQRGAAPENKDSLSYQQAFHHGGRQPTRRWPARHPSADVHRHHGGAGQRDPGVRQPDAWRRHPRHPRPSAGHRPLPAARPDGGVGEHRHLRHLHRHKGTEICQSAHLQRRGGGQGRHLSPLSHAHGRVAERLVRVRRRHPHHPLRGRSAAVGPSMV